MRLKLPTGLVVWAVVLVAIAPALVAVTVSVANGSAPGPLSTEVQPAQLIVARTSSVPTCSPSGLCPAMLDKAYGLNTLHLNASGAGQTIIIDDACGDAQMPSDLNTFDAQFNLPSPTLNVIHPQGTPCVNGGWSTETSLDVEWSHVMAPNATIDLLEAAVPDPQDVYGVWTYVINHHLGNQISDSFGGAGCYTEASCNATIGQGIGSCTSTAGTLGVNVSKILTKAASAGVTVLASSGDSGAWGIAKNPLKDDAVPADCAGVLVTGGTTLEVSSSGKYLGESAWSGSGGGYAVSAEPKYQVSAGVPDRYHTLAKPDVAADADPGTGVWVYNSLDGWFVVGGTSVSSPLWTGFMADVNGIRAAHHLAPAGLVNPFLYSTVYGVNGSSPLYALDFHDITVGNTGWPAGTGWDAATGLGSFQTVALAQTLGTNPKA